MPEEEVLPTWAPRVAKRKIKQLYDDDARGMHDEELIEDVGYSLLSRCDSFMGYCQMLWMSGERILDDYAAVFNSPSSNLTPSMTRGMSL